MFSNQVIKFQEVITSLHWTKLKIIENIFYSESGKNTLLALPSKLHSLICEELHNKMGHLKPEVIYQLAKGRVLWPEMKEDLIHFFIRLCSCVKTKPPYSKPVTPLWTIIQPNTLCVEFCIKIFSPFRWLLWLLWVFSSGQGLLHLLHTGIPNKKQSITYRSRKYI